MIEPRIRWRPSRFEDHDRLPIARRSPEAWIATMGDGTPGLDNGEYEPGIAPLHDGDRVSFRRLVIYGEATLLIDINERWPVDPPAPSGLNEVISDRDGISGADVEGCVAKLIAIQAPANEYTLRYFSVDDIPHRFDLATLSFAQIGAVRGETYAVQLRLWP